MYAHKGTHLSEHMRQLSDYRQPPANHQLSNDVQHHLRDKIDLHKYNHGTAVMSEPRRIRNQSVIY